MVDRVWRVTFPAQFIVMRVEQSTPREEVKRLMLRQVQQVVEQSLEEISDAPAGVSQSAEEAGREPVQ
jgi:hypothetical protein